MNEKFAKVNLVNASIYRGSTEKKHKKAKKEFMGKIDTTCETHLFAYVEVEKYNKIQLQCFIECKNANSKSDNINIHYYGLFEGSEATKIVILSCGNNIKNMSWMFADCSSLTILDLSSFNTNNVKDMRFMFKNCNSLTHLNLSNFKTQNVTNIGYIFYKCFKEEQPSTLICQASTIQKITDDGGSCLIIPNKINNEIKKTIANDNNNIWKVYKCSVKRVGDNPEITKVEEYQPHQ